MKFKYQTYEREFKKSKAELREAYQKGDVYKVICFLRYLTCFYYTINYTLADEELEQITKDVSHKILGDTVIQKGNDNTVLFYDGFGLVSRGLANIYVKALDELGFQVIWVMYEWAEDLNEIQNKFADRKNVQFMLIPKKSVLERMQELQNIIVNISPKYVYLYTLPDDVVGLGTFSTVTGDVERFLIDLTDHAYWLGKCATDYVIGFRNIGYNVAVKYRNFDSSQVLLLPYYPEKREDYSFEGMPFDIEKHEFVFSGGSIYKIEGSELYADMVRYILDINSKIYFVYAGNGKSKILDAIKQQYPKRFYQIPERKDLDKIMQKAKFYLSTYPMFGGLMTQYAAQNGCIPLSLCNVENPLANPITLVLHPEEADYFVTNFDDACKKIKQLMEDRIYYEKMKENLNRQVISEEEFKNQLENIMRQKMSKFQGHIKDTDIESFLDIYRRRATYEIYANTIFNSRNKWVYRRHPLIWLRGKIAQLKR